jgi:hypothetical protein
MAVAARSPDSFVPVAAAAERLRISRNSVKRRLAAGLLRGYADPANGYQYVSEASLANLEHLLERLRAAALLPGSEPLDERWTDPTGDQD